MTSNKLDRLLFKPELKSLGGGRTWSTLLFLGVIYSFALFSLGSGEQVRHFLEQQMKDPFVQLLSSEVPEGECGGVTDKLLGNDQLKESFNISDIRLVAKDYEAIKAADGSSRKVLVGSYDEETTFYGVDKELYTLREVSPIIQKLIDTNAIPRNWRSHPKSTEEAINAEGTFAIDGINVHPLWGMLSSDTTLFLTSAHRCQPFDAMLKTGVILNAATANSLGITDVIAKGDELPMIQWMQGERGQPVALPVLGITRVLPLELDMAIHVETWGYLKSEEGQKKSKEGQQHTSEEVYFVPQSEMGRLTDPNLPKSVPVPSGMVFSSSAFGSGMRQVKSIGTSVDLLTFKKKDRSEDLKFETVLFKMKDLTVVRSFANEIENNKAAYGCDKSVDDSNPTSSLEIDLSDVEAKENLSIFNGFAQLLSLALIVISLILIINYTGAILRLHINKNKKNLGTLTAFGYKNSTITSLYLKITATILSLSFFVSYMVVWPLGHLGFNAFLSITDLDKSLADVSFAHWPLYYSIPLFVLLPLAIVSVRIRKQLKATPGDLVYDR